MEFSHAGLKGLMLLKKHGKIADVARELGLTQSAVSKALSSMEDHLGVTLVERASRPFRLTSDGLLLADYAERIYTDWDQVLKEIRQRRSLKSGLIRIASFGTSSSARLLPQLIQDFRAYYPSIDFSLVEYEDADIPEILAEQEADFGVMTGHDEAHDALEMGQDQLVALMPASHPLAASKAIRARDFEGLPFIMSRAGSQNLIKNWFARQDVTPNVMHHIRQIGSILSMIDAGMGVSIVADYAIPDHRGGVITKPLEPVARRPIYLVRAGSHAGNEAALRFWKFVQDQNN